MAKKEENLQIAISNYLKLQYPSTIFTFEASGLRLPIGLAKKAKAMRSDTGLPDLLIFEPKGKFHGLFIELKAKTIYKKDGGYLKDDHIEDQAHLLHRLKVKGYMACFAIGFDDAKKIIDSYFNL
jgi:hypothetical protein